MSHTPKTQIPTTLAQLKAARTALKNPHVEFHQRLTPLQKFAVQITNRIGTMGFFLIIVTWTLCWLGWNLLAPKELQFDPPMGFVLWLFISNLIQIFLMPLIMIGQNIQGKRSEARMEHDLAVNVKAEKEIEVILENIEYQLRHLEYQNAILEALALKNGVDVAEIQKLKV